MYQSKNQPLKTDLFIRIVGKMMRMFIKFTL